MQTFIIGVIFLAVYFAFSFVVYNCVSLFISTKDPYYNRIEAVCTLVPILIIFVIFWKCIYCIIYNKPLIND